MAQRWPARERRVAGPTRERLIVGAFVAVLVGACGGWLINSASRPAHPVVVTGTFTGTVTTVSGDGAAGCVLPDGHDDLRCGRFYRAADVGRGQRVQVALETVPAGAGGHEHVFVVYPAP